MIYLDACLLIYLLEGPVQWGSAVAEAMALRERSGADFCVSPLVKCECLVGPLKRGNPVLEQAYLDLFDRFIPAAMTDAVYLRAARLRATFGLRTPDALHLACAQIHRCEELWTNDDRLARASHSLARNILSSPTG